MPPPRTIRIAALVVCAVVAACAQGSEYDFDDDDDGTSTASPSTSSSSGTATATNTGTTTSSSGIGGSGTGSGAGGTNTGATGGTGGTGGSGGTSGGGGTACSHDKCDVGVALSPTCDSCVSEVCYYDDYCCTTEWDDTCVDEVWDYCGIDCYGGGGSGSVGAGDLVITEIMNNPAVVSDANGEWFELYNDTTTSIDLQGLVIRHQAVSIDPNAVHTIASSVTIAAGGYAVLGLNADSSSNGSVSVDYEYPGSVNLGNTSDYLAVETASQVVIDATAWNESSGLDPSGASRSLDPGFVSASSNDDDSHFCEATSFVTGSTGDRGTPGGANDACP